MADDYKTFHELPDAANNEAGELAVWSDGGAKKLGYSAHFAGLTMNADAAAWRVSLGLDSAVLGPALAVDLRIPIFDGVTGKLVKDSGWSITAAAMLLMGGSTSAFPALKRSGATVLVRLADDSGSALLAALSVTLDNAGLLRFGTRGQASSPADGVILLQNNAGSDFSRLQFGGTTSSFPSLKRSSSALQVRLADDSAFAPFACGAIDISSSVGGQIKFPASPNLSSDANTLDRYEEGSFTVIDVSGQNITITVNEGRYTVIGNRCFLNGKLTYAGSGNPGVCQFGSVPIASATASDTSGGCGSFFTRNNNAGTIWMNYPDLLPFINGAQLTNAQMQAGYMLFDHSYRV